MGQFPKTPLRDLFTAASADCLNLLSKCLIYDPRKRVSAKEVSPIYRFVLLNLTPPQALYHPYFSALPYPTHPSKLPKPAKKESAIPLEEVDGNVEFDAAGPGVRANAPNKLKRKLSSDELGSRPIARRLDFTQHM